MSSTGSLKAFLKDKKEQDEKTGRLPFKEEKIQLRRRAIAELFASIEEWLQSSKEDGIVTVVRSPFSHVDKDLNATLDEEMLKVVVGVSEVMFFPGAGSIAGAIARVDVRCGDRVLPIVLLAERGWHFLIRGAVTRTDPVSEESFGEALKELLAG